MPFHFPLLHKIFHSLMSGLNSSSDRFRTSIVSYLTRLSRDHHMFNVIFIMFFVNVLVMFKFSTRVIFGFAIFVIQIMFSVNHSRHFRRGYFLRDFHDFPWLAHTPSLLESTTTILLLCINRQLKCCNPAVVRLLTAPKIPGVLISSFGLLCSPDSRTVTSSSGTIHCC